MTGTDPSDRRVINPAGVPALPGSSAAVAAGGLIFTGAMMAFGPDHGLHPAATVDPDAVPSLDPLELQSEVLLDHLRDTLAAAGAEASRDIMRIWQWMPARYPSDEDYAVGPIVWPAFTSGDGYTRVARRHLDALRTSTGIGVRQLPLSGGRMAVEVIAATPVEGVAKQGFPDTEADEVLPFVSTIRLGDWLTTAAGASDLVGDWGTDLHRGEPSLVAPDARVNPYIWLGSEIEAQTEWTLGRLAKAAERAGTDLRSCVHAEVTLGDPSDYQGFERVWKRWFPVDPPARRLTTGARIVVKGVRVEIGLTCLPAGDAKVIRGATATMPVGHASMAVRAKDLLFVSTRLPVDGRGVVPPQLRPDRSRTYLRRPAYEQAMAVLDDLDTICRSAGTDIAEVCKVQINMADLAELPDVLDAFARTFPKSPPALSVIGMGGPQPLLAPHARLQADAVAWLPGAR